MSVNRGRWLVIRGGGGSSGTPVQTYEVPAGDMNSANKVFTISRTPTFMLLLLNGVEQQVGVDYTIAANVITYTVPPKSNDYHSIRFFF